MPIRLEGLSQREKDGGIFPDGDCAGLLAKNRARVETWLSIGKELAFYLPEIPSGAITLRIDGFRSRAESDGIFLGGACADLLAKIAPR